MVIHRYTHTYHAGTALEILFYPEPESEHSEVATDPLHLTATIIKPFEPFTLSSVLHVRLSPAPTLAIPSELVIKLYDRRYTFDTRQSYRSGAWTPSHERALQDFRAGGSRVGFGGDGGSPGRNVGRNVGQIESFLESAARKTFAGELAAYRKLRPLQGADIPRLYGRVETQGLAIDVAGLAIEYIPGYTLREVPIRAKKEEWQKIGDEAVSVVRRLSATDVINYDVRLDNILIVDKEDGGKKAIMIDLGGSSVRGEDVDDDMWYEMKASHDGEGRVGYDYKGFIEFRHGGVIEYKRSEMWNLTVDEETVGLEKTVGLEEIGRMGPEEVGPKKKPLCPDRVHSHN